MSRVDEIRKNGKKISLSKSIEFIEQFYNEKTFTIKSDFPTINTVECKIKKGNRCFEYNAGEILPYGPPAKYQSEGYGFQKPFELENEFERLKAKNGASNISIKIGEGFTSEGKITELESNFGSVNSFFRAIIPFADYAEKPITFIESVGFNVGTWTRVAGYLSVDTGNGIYGVYEYKSFKEIKSLYIENEEKTSYEEFEKSLGAIIYSFGIVSGSLIRDEIFILQFESKEYKNVKGFQYRKLEDSVNGAKSIDPSLLKHIDKNLKKTPYLPLKVFSNLVKKCLTDSRFQRALKIISESYIYPLEVRASTYSVALETLKNIILEENAKKINPFKSKKEARGIIKQLKEIIEGVEDDKFNNKKAILNKIEQLNQVTNKDGFLLTFKLLGIELNEDDKRCIANRNDFLHGRIPFEEEHDENYQLQHIVYKLHFLLSNIILKMAEYDGLILNTIILVDLIDFKKKLKEPLFRR
jgi:hypothetical protein